MTRTLTNMIIGLLVVLCTSALAVTCEELYDSMSDDDIKCIGTTTTFKLTTGVGCKDQYGQEDCPGERDTLCCNFGRTECINPTCAQYPAYWNWNCGSLPAGCKPAGQT